MNVVLSYSGGVSRGEFLARSLAADNQLYTFYQPNISSSTKKMVDGSLLRENVAIRMSRSIINYLNKSLKKKPTKRYLISRITDSLVAQQIQSGGRVFIGESGICLRSLKAAKQLGYITILDRTNSHILHQNRIWENELRKNGVYWKPNSERVTACHLAEYEAADYIFVLSSFVKKTFLENGVLPEKLFLVPSGISSDVFNPRCVSKNIRKVVFCGSISLKKGAHYLLKAAEILKNLGVEVLLVGSTSSEIIEKLKKKSKNCTIMSRVPQPELPEIFSGSCCFVLPSLDEGLPKVTLEAMACGLPVITTENAAGDDLVEEGQTGFIIPTGDPDLLSEKILWMVKNPKEAEEMGRRGLAKMKQTYTEKKYYERFKVALNKIYYSEENRAKKSV